MFALTSSTTRQNKRAEKKCCTISNANAPRQFRNGEAGGYVSRRQCGHTGRRLRRRKADLPEVEREEHAEGDARRVHHR